MTQRINDSGALRMGATDLNYYGEELNWQLNMLKNTMDNAGGTWKDQQYQNFVHRMLGVMETAKQYHYKNQAIVVALNETARLIDEYNSQT